MCSNFVLYICKQLLSLHQLESQEEDNLSYDQSFMSYDENKMESTSENVMESQLLSPDQSFVTHDDDTATSVTSGEISLRSLGYNQMSRSPIHSIQSDNEFSLNTLTRNDTCDTRGSDNQQSYFNNPFSSDRKWNGR